MDKIRYVIVSLLLFVAVWLFWWIGYPQMLSYQEQYQLFLFTSSYFAERIGMVGGLADYVSEFIVQFYYIPVIGAAMLALTLTLMQVLVGAYCIRMCDGRATRLSLYIISAIPTIEMLHFMGDENMLLSYPVAIVITLAATLLMRLADTRGWLYLSVTAVVYIPLYWLVGPAAILFPILTILQSTSVRRKWLWTAASLAIACAEVVIIANTVCRQYPYEQLLMGINYYRISNVHPEGLFVVAATIIILPFLRLCLRRISPKHLYPVTFIFMLAAIVQVPSGFDGDKMEIFRYDAMVRNGDWHGIIAAAEKRRPVNDFCLQGLNLALAKTGQLGDKMFEYPQTGINSLIAKRELDNTTCLIAAEALYHLGMINTAFRYNFDTQEAIMNDRKSGRFMKRMAECMIINGRYDVASKYIDMLKNSMFYSKWANEADKYLNDEEAINQHPDWGEKRRIRFRQELFYDYNEIEKVLGLLALESNGQNLLAWDYFNAALMLKGDLPTLCGMYHYAPETFHLTEVPKHIQEAIALYWTMGHPSFDGLPYKVSDKVKMRITKLAGIYAQNPNNPEAWAKDFGDTYWAYFLLKQQQNQQNPSTDSQSGSQREG